MQLLETETKVVSRRHPYALEHTTFTSKQFRAFTGCNINKTLFFVLLIDRIY